MDSPRLEELRRRVARDPASIAFAQLAEEYRRAGDCEEAIRIARAGLTRHPDYVSARVTLGRALFEWGRHDEARLELERASRQAPDNLAASRALFELNRSSPPPGPISRDRTVRPQPPIATREDSVVQRPEPEAAAPASSPPPHHEEPAAAMDIPLDVGCDVAAAEAPPEGPLVGLDAWMANAPGDAEDPTTIPELPPLPDPSPQQPDPVATLDAWLDAIVAERETSRRRQD